VPSRLIGLGIGSVSCVLKPLGASFAIQSTSQNVPSNDFLAALLHRQSRDYRRRTSWVAQPQPPTAILGYKWLTIGENLLADPCGASRLDRPSQTLPLQARAEDLNQFQKCPFHSCQSFALVTLRRYWLMSYRFRLRAFCITPWLGESLIHPSVGLYYPEQTYPLFARAQKMSCFRTWMTCSR
jgi:hypothetical protein